MCRVDSTPTNLIKFCGLFDTWRLFFLHTRDFGSFLFLGAEKMVVQVA